MQPIIGKMLLLLAVLTSANPQRVISVTWMHDPQDISRADAITWANDGIERFNNALRNAGGAEFELKLQAMVTLPSGFFNDAGVVCNIDSTCYSMCTNHGSSLPADQQGDLFFCTVPNLPPGTFGWGNPSTAVCMYDAATWPANTNSCFEHEIGHALGAPHDAGPGGDCQVEWSIMCPYLGPIATVNYFLPSSINSMNTHVRANNVGEMAPESCYEPYQSSKDMNQAAQISDLPEPKNCEKCQCTSGFVGTRRLVTGQTREECQRECDSLEWCQIVMHKKVGGVVTQADCWLLANDSCDIVNIDYLPDTDTSINMFAGNFYNVTQKSTSCNEYKFYDYGTSCTGDVNYEVVKTEAECQEAFQSLSRGIPTLWNEGDSIGSGAASRPAGCYGRCAGTICSLNFNPMVSDAHAALGTLVPGQNLGYVCKRKMTYEVQMQLSAQGLTPATFHANEESIKRELALQLGLTIPQVQLSLDELGWGRRQMGDNLTIYARIFPNADQTAAVESVLQDPASLAAELSTRTSINFAEVTAGDIANSVAPLKSNAPTKAPTQSHDLLDKDSSSSGVTMIFALISFAFLL